MYSLLCGYPPFIGNSFEEIKNAIYALENKELQVEVLGYAPRLT